MMSTKSSRTSVETVVLTACLSRSIRCTSFTDGGTAHQCSDEGARRGALGGRQQRVHVLGTGFLVVVERHPRVFCADREVAGIRVVDVVGTAEEHHGGKPGQVRVERTDQRIL